VQTGSGCDCGSYSSNRGTPTPDAIPPLTIFGRQNAAAAAKLNRRQKELLSRLELGDQIVPGDYYQQMEGLVSQRQAQRDLSRLEAGGWLLQEGDGPSTVYVRTEQEAP